MISTRHTLPDGTPYTVVLEPVNGRSGEVVGYHCVVVCGGGVWYVGKAPVSHAQPPQDVRAALTTQAGKLVSERLKMASLPSIDTTNWK